MNRFKLQILVFTAVAAAGGGALPADDLDAALEAQKNKAGRRVYTDSALLQDSKLEIPKVPSETEKTADKQFYESADGQMAPNTSPRPAPPPPAPVKIPLKDRNWLTPARLDDEKKADEPPSWTDYSETATLHDPALLFPKGSQEEELIDRMVQERLQKSEPVLKPAQSVPSGFQELRPLNAQSETSSRAEPNSITPSYLKPADIARPNLLPSVSLPGKKTDPFGLNLPAPSPAAAGFGAVGGPFQPQGFGLSSVPGTSLQQEPLDMLSRQPAALSPLQQIRKAAPINRRDPFRENDMPVLKQSIWE